MSKLIITRENSYVAFGSNMGVFIDGEKAALLGNDVKLEVPLPEGEYKFAVKFQRSLGLWTSREMIVNIIPGQDKAVSIFPAKPAIYVTIILSAVFSSLCGIFFLPQGVNMGLELLFRISTLFIGYTLVSLVFRNKFIIVKS